MSLTFEVGKHYRTRSGEKATCLLLRSRLGFDYPVVMHDEAGRVWYVTYAGAYETYNSQSSNDIISPWVDKPTIPHDFWQCMPAWAQYVAQDPDGEWMWYSHKPEPVCTCWSTGMLGYYDTIPPKFAPKFSGDWRESLLCRDDG